MISTPVKSPYADLPPATSEMPGYADVRSARTLSATALTIVLASPSVSVTSSSRDVFPVALQARIEQLMCVDAAGILTRSGESFTTAEIEAAQREIEAMSFSASSSFLEFERSLPG
ncbi:MAG: hypothetical protein ACYC7F_06915 [Gemmatimonadaceae bacterium]